MHLCRANLNNNTSYENVSKLNLQFIYLALFTFSLWYSSSETNYMSTHGASRTHHTLPHGAADKNKTRYTTQLEHLYTEGYACNVFYVKKCSFHVLPQMAALYSKMCSLKAM
jgi:hypothetical protein